MFASEMVKRLRKAAGFSAATFGRTIEVSARSVRRYEAGELEPPISVAGRMARALKVPLDDLYVHDPEADSASTARGENAIDGAGRDLTGHEVAATGAQEV